MLKHEKKYSSFVFTENKNILRNKQKGFSSTAIYLYSEIKYHDSEPQIIIENCHALTHIRRYCCEILWKKFNCFKILVHVFTNSKADEQKKCINYGLPLFHQNHFHKNFLFSFPQKMVNISSICTQTVLHWPETI